MLWKLSLLGLFLITTSYLSAQTLGKDEKPVMTEISENKLQIGKLVLDKKEKEITFSATLGNPDSIIEYLLVNDFGKVHEALFVTEVRPFDLNLALKLLGYKESKELFRVIGEDFMPTELFHDENEDVKIAARFDLFASWNEGDKTKKIHANELILNSISKKHAKVLPYIYGGSYLLEGRLKSQMSGDIIAIYTDRGAIANFSNEGREDDTIWFPNIKRLPKDSTPITLTIKKHKFLN